MTKASTRRLLAAFGFFAALSASAAADPQGTYAVSGNNPDDGAAYEGTVVVTKTGDTYQLEWDVNGTQFIGIGLGGEAGQNRLTVGPSAPTDTVLSVGYLADGGFGQAFFVEQPDGTWKGIWAYGGGQKIGIEVWQRQ